MSVAAILRPVRYPIDARHLARSTEEKERMKDLEGRGSLQEQCVVADQHYDISVVCQAFVDEEVVRRKIADRLRRACDVLARQQATKELEDLCHDVADAAAALGEAVTNFGDQLNELIEVDLPGILEDAEQTAHEGAPGYAIEWRGSWTQLAGLIAALRDAGLVAGRPKYWEAVSRVFVNERGLHPAPDTLRQNQGRDKAIFEELVQSIEMYL